MKRVQLLNLFLVFGLLFGTSSFACASASHTYTALWITLRAPSLVKGKSVVAVAAQVNLMTLNHRILDSKIVQLELTEPDHFFGKVTVEGSAIDDTILDPVVQYTVTYADQTREPLLAEKILAKTEDHEGIPYEEAKGNFEMAYRNEGDTNQTRAVGLRFHWLD